MKEYDVVIIGSGMTGTTIAQKRPSENKRVAVTNYRPCRGNMHALHTAIVQKGAAEVTDYARKLYSQDT